MKNLIIETKYSDEKELQIREVLFDLNSKYPVPIFTDKVLVKKDAISHSHPILTIGTREVEPLLILKTFVHEQFHWFESNHPKYNQAMIYFKSIYINLGDCDKGEEKSDSFWQHLIVCFNTRNFLQDNLNKVEVEKIYSAWQSYPLTEKFTEDNFEKIKQDLNKFDMVHK